MSCATRVRAALQAVGGVRDARVDFDASRAYVVVDRAVRQDALVRAVRRAGYGCTFKSWRN